MFKLRYYQQAIKAAVLATWEHHQGAAVVAATGVGKTESYLDLAVSSPGRVLVIAHRDYLLSSPISRLAAHGFDDVAVEKAESKSEVGLIRSKIVFASIQSLCRPSRLAAFNPADFSTVIIDEGHRAVAKTYRTVLDHFRQNPRVRVLILTATPKRKDNIALGNLCDGDIEVAYTYGPKQAADEGWIVPLRFFRRVVAGLDFSKVRMKGSDLDQDEVEHLLLEEKPLHQVCASLAEDRGPTIVFCPGVTVARAYAVVMNRYRRDRAAVLWADSPDEDRELAGKKLANGDLDYIFNVDLFTEGYDVPELARVVWAAPTASLVRFTQGTGRVFRPHSSIKAQLAGGIEDSEARRQLHLQSPKPFGAVVTYYPENCKHQLCEPNDILGGDELPPDVRAAAKLVQEATAAQPGGSDPEADIETAKALLELRELLEKRRQRIKAQAEVSDQEYDAFSGSRNRTVESGGTGEIKKAAAAVSSDWPEGDAASPKQLGWLRYQGVSDPDSLGLTKWRACVVRDLMEAGFSAEKALSFGKRQALAVRGKLQAKKEAPAE